MASLAHCPVVPSPERLALLVRPEHREFGAGPPEIEGGMPSPGSTERRGRNPQCGQNRGIPVPPFLPRAAPASEIPHRLPRCGSCRVSEQQAAPERSAAQSGDRVKVREQSLPPRGDRSLLGSGYRLRRQREMRHLLHAVHDGEDGLGPMDDAQLQRVLRESCRFAGASTRPSGIPVPSTSSERLYPSFPGQRGCGPRPGRRRGPWRCSRRPRVPPGPGRRSGHVSRGRWPSAW